MIAVVAVAAAVVVATHQLSKNRLSNCYCCHCCRYCSCSCSPVVAVVALVAVVADAVVPALAVVDVVFLLLVTPPAIKKTGYQK